MAKKLVKGATLAEKITGALGAINGFFGTNGGNVEVIIEASVKLNKKVAKEINAPMQKSRVEELLKALNTQNNHLYKLVAAATDADKKHLLQLIEVNNNSIEKLGTKLGLIEQIEFSNKSKTTPMSLFDQFDISGLDDFNKALLKSGPKNKGKFRLLKW